jgi:hypothetical protein
MGIRRLTSATAVVTLSLQLIVTALSAVSLCLDRPHTHGGLPAQDCPMHHQHQPAAIAEANHQHHAGAHQDATPDASRIGCRCSSDTLLFLISDLGVFPERVLVRVPTSTGLLVTAFKTATLDLRIPPLSPPPRPSLS